MAENLGEDLGRLFEVGFNVGILTYINQHQITNRFNNLYRQDLSKLSYSKMLKRLADKEKVVSEHHRHIVEKWCTFFLQKGFLAGLNFFGEYLKSTEWSERKLRRLEIIYCQFCFSDDNSIGTYPKGRNQFFKEVLAQFGDLKIDNDKYRKKGEFLNADTLILMQCGKEQKVLCVDLSVFSIKSIRDLLDVDSVEVIKDILIREINYLKSKSIFANLGLDTKTLGLNFSPDLAHYFSAFKREDKESIKLIQAASYTHSFYEFMRSHNLTTDDNAITFNVVGYSDRAINAMSLNLDNLRVLETCSTIYKTESSNTQINDARKKVLKLIQRNTAKSFNGGEEFIKKLLNVAGGITTVTHTERIEGFLNSQDNIPLEYAEQLHVSPELPLRDAHAELIKQALMSEDVYIFLTANAGIGKTTAIANVLKTPTYVDEGFLFFYASPRTQVNLDIIEKFTDEDSQALFSDKLLTITTNSDLIKKHGGHCTVNYLSNTRDTHFIEKAVHFINQNNPIQEDTRPRKKLAITNEDRIQYTEQKNRGVLDSICQAIYTVIESKISNNILATVSIQSLKKTRNGDTLEQFEKIFKSAYNEREGKVIPAKMQEISQRIKHLFIMIDEITGDDSGVEFLSRIGEIINKYKLTDSQYGFNVKVIVADASIVNTSIIEQHLKSSSVEPNKIFFRRAIENCPPIAKDSFTFNKLSASAINTNSYPAKSLNITYKVIIESRKYVQTADIEKKNDLKSRLQKQIIDDIYKLLNNTESGQIIVYIQNKNRLTELIEKIREDRGSFQDQKDYIEIHADLSEPKKQEIKTHQNSVKIVFMTASASRGLSFPKTKHILVDVPQFEVEKNLMEIIQVIYRGRGSYVENGVKKSLDNRDKELIFYFSERSVYYDNPKSSTEDSDTQRQLSLQESVLSILNVLLVLKTSIMTRIVGFGRIVKKDFIMIPIGGKSVTAAGQTFSSTMSLLINKLTKEAYKQPSNQSLKEVYSSLEDLLNRSEIVLKKSENFIDNQVCYLSLRESLANKFVKSINKNFAELLDFKVIEAGYISGSLLVIPLAGRLIEEKFEMRMKQEILKYANNDLLNKMYDLKRDPSSTESLKYAMDEAIELVKLLKERSEKTQTLEQYSQRFDRYYALPLFTFISSEEITKYLANTEEPEDKCFKNILKQYLQALYPIGNILPIGSKYSDFPFIVFTSYSLKEMRNKIFTNNYLISSNELNVLNLILATDE